MENRRADDVGSFGESFAESLRPAYTAASVVVVAKTTASAATSHTRIIFYFGLSQSGE